MFKPYIVSYESETYNQSRSYFRNQNRYARSESFDTIEEAHAFVEKIKPTARRSHPIKIRDYYRAKTVAKFEWDPAKSEWRA